MFLRAGLIFACTIALAACHTGMTYTREDLEMARRFGNSIKIESQEDRYWKDYYRGKPAREEGKTRYVPIESSEPVAVASSGEWEGMWSRAKGTTTRKGVGDTYYHSDGSSTRKGVGGEWHHSDGSSTRKGVGDVWYHSDGSTTRKGVGDVYYHSDGSSTRKGVGDVWYHSDGSTTRKGVGDVWYHSP